MTTSVRVTTESHESADDRRLEEAAEWLVVLQSDDLSSELLQRWDQWVADPDNQSAFDDQIRLWQQLDHLDPPSVPTPSQLAADGFDGSVPVAAWQASRQRAAGRRKTVTGFVLAAFLAAVMLGTALLLRDVPFLSGTTPQLMVYETGQGQHRTVALTDGSEVTLGGRTSLSVGFSSSNRTVVLNQGEGLFKVAKDSDRPFVVVAGSGTITAVGTEFNVRQSDNRVVVTVTEGTVAVAPRAVSINAAPTAANRTWTHPARLEHGHELAYDSQGLLSEVERTDPLMAAAWRGGLLRYQREPLKHVIADVNRYSSQQMVMGDRAAGELLLTGTVFTAHVDEWIRSLDGIFPVEVVATDSEHVLIRSRSEAPMTTSR